MRSKRRERGPALTQAAIDRIEEALTSHSWTIADLAAKSGVAHRTLQDWLGRPAREAASTGNPLRPRRDNLECVATALELDLEELTTRKAPAPVRGDRTFDSLMRVARGVDRELIEITRSLCTRPRQTVRTAYRRVLSDALHEHGFSLQEFIDLLEDPSAQEQLVHTLPDPRLRIHIDDHFKSIDFMVDGASALTVADPLLLWDCHCSTPGRSSTRESCPIHGHTNGDLVDDLFQSDLMEIDWRGVRIRWRNERILWPPSVDSFALLLDLFECGIPGDECRSLLDLGSGTGFLGVCLVRASRHVEHLTLADWLLTPALFGAVNWCLNKSGHETTQLAVRVGMMTDWMTSTSTLALPNVAVCNPPYLPILEGFEEVGTHAVVAGTDLLEHSIQRSADIAGRVFIQFSHLADSMAQDAASKGQMGLDRLHEHGRTVPFRVNESWKEMPKYFEALVAMEGGLMEQSDKRHPYWHRLRTYEVVSASG